MLTGASLMFRMRFMDNVYLQLIAAEEAKIEALKQRIHECEEKIRVLRTLIPRDELDDALTKMLSSRNPIIEASAATVPPSAQTTEAVSTTAAEVPEVPEVPEAAEPGELLELDVYKDPTRKLPTAALNMLAFLAEPRTRRQMEDFALQSGRPLSKSALSTFVWTYRTQYGFVVVTPSGDVQITERGKKYLAQHHKQETPESAVTDSEVVSTQAADLTPPEGIDREGGF